MRAARPWWMAAAAAVVLVVVVFFVVRGTIRDSRLETLALLAISNHEHDHRLSVETRDADVLGQALSRKLPFEVVLPVLGQAFELDGGRKCKLGTHPVAFTVWSGPGGKFTLFQCRPDDFGLPLELPRQVVRAEAAAVSGEPPGVLLWADGGRGYILVGAEDAFDRLKFSQRRTSE